MDNHLEIKVGRTSFWNCYIKLLHCTSIGVNLLGGILTCPLSGYGIR